MAVAGQQVIKTVCQACICSCGINVYLEDGKVVKIDGMREHPVNEGRLCPKAAGIIDWVYHPDRLRYPMKRENGEWKRISWDEALDTIAGKLKEVKEKYGARALACCFGMIFFVQGRIGAQLARRFTDVYGTPNVFSVDSMCYRVRTAAYMLTLGKRVVPDLDVDNSNCIVLWGHNPEASIPPLGWRLSKERLRGKKLIVIDPRCTPLAKRADIHVQPRPGSDCALALGMLNVIIARGLYDKEFVDKWTVGFDKLAEHVKSYPPEEVEKITWVPRSKIEEIAEVYATNKPACIVQGWNALDQTTAGFHAGRAIAILTAITGNFDVPGGLIAHIEPPYRPARLPEKMEGMPLGIDSFPLHYQAMGRVFGEGQGMVLPETILTGKPYPIKAMVIAGSNPALTWPNSKKIEEALKELDFLVVMDLFLTKTAKLAHLVLPATSFLEREEWPHFPFCLGLPYIMLRKKVIEIEECWPDTRFWLELAKRMGYQDYFPWRDVEEYFDYILEPAGFTVKHLRENEPAGLFYTPIEYRRYEVEGLPTPSGKVELYCETLEKIGYEPMPVHKEPPESPISTPDIAKEYPLILTTGARIVEFTHSQFRSVPRLRRRFPEALAEMHVDTATKYGIEDGDAIAVETRRGSIEIKAKVSEDIVPGVVNISHGWEEANVNILTDETPANTVGGDPAFKGLLCKVQKKASK